jgi:hypothetical protein
MPPVYTLICKCGCGRVFCTTRKNVKYFSNECRRHLRLRAFNTASTKIQKRKHKPVVTGLLVGTSEKRRERFVSVGKDGR